MPERLRATPPKNAITLTLDSEEILANEGDSVAEALLGAGYRSISRSPKFHRPRGAACLRGGCEGCLVRIDGTPNLSACLVRARDGMRVETQNTFGKRELDLLRVTDWVFPHGINHHEFMAGIPGVQDAMQAIARRITGLGTLPDAALAARPAERRELDVLIVGSGPSAQALASILVAGGRSVELVDDALEPGGVLRYMPASLRVGYASIESSFRALGLSVQCSATAGAVFEGAVLVVAQTGAQVLQPRALVLATGAHDTMPPFVGNDLPGVMSARAAGLLYARGVLPGKKPVTVEYPGGGPFAQALAQDSRVPHYFGTIQSVGGAFEATSVTLTLRDGKQITVDADAVLVDAPRAPAYELAVQAGGKVLHQPEGFVVQATNGQIAEGVFALGEVVGTSLEPEAIAFEAQKVAAAILAAF
jgi:sarcosine oxidase, subunit alpha